MGIFSVTERSGFMRCRTAWNWGSFNREGWTSIIHKPALQIGHLWHATQAEWSLHPELDPNNLLLDMANQELDRVRAEYLEKIGAPISEMELGPSYEGIKLLMGMTKNYHDRWGSPLPDGFTMVSPEQTCVVPIPNTEHRCYTCFWPGHGSVSGFPVENCPECSGTGSSVHYLSGTLDGLIQSADGRIYVLERKTYGQRPKVEVLEMQDQFLAYLWILRELGIGEVGGLAYDGAWKRAQPPKGSTLEDLFLRTLLQRNKHELDDFTHQVRAQAMEMGNPNLQIYPNRRWDGCWDCDFVEPCIAKMKGYDYQSLLNSKFVKRPKSEDSTRELKEVEV